MQRETLITGTISVEKKGTDFKFSGNGELAFFTIIILGALVFAFFYFKWGHTHVKKIFKRKQK